MFGEHICVKERQEIHVGENFSPLITYAECAGRMRSREIVLKRS